MHNVKQLRHHQAIKLLNCRVFVPVSTGLRSRTVAQETPGQ